MHLSNGTRWLLRIGTAITLAFIYIPLIVIAIYAFNESRSQSWPIEGLTTEWFAKAFDNPGVRDALWTSLKAGLGATAIALVLGTLAALAVSRYRFFGRETISFLVILPLALPGHRHRHGAERDLHAGAERRPDPVHGDRGPRHLLHRRGLQQRGRATATHGHARWRRRPRTSAPTAGRPSATSPCPRCARPSWPARCWPLRFRSTRSSSPRSPRDPSRRCRSGSSRNYSRPNQLPIVNVVGLLVILLSIIPRAQ